MKPTGVRRAPIIRLFFQAERERTRAIFGSVNGGPGGLELAAKSIVVGIFEMIGFSMRVSGSADGLEIRLGDRTLVSG